MGVKSMAGTFGWTMDPPAATEYAVLPVGVASINPSACTCSGMTGSAANDQSTNQLIDQSIDQAVNQSLNQSCIAMQCNDYADVLVLSSCFVCLHIAAIESVGRFVLGLIRMLYIRCRSLRYTIRGLDRV